MSRRDTIIIAVLLNTGLLAILFMIAINPEEDHIADKLDFNNAFVEVEERRAPAAQSPVVLAHQSEGDEVDNVLKDFAATISTDSFVKASSHLGPKEEQPLAVKMEVVEKAKPERTRLSKDLQTSFLEVAVKQGDILGRIAQAYGVSVNAIIKANNLTTDRLQIGQVLKIPTGMKSGEELPDPHVRSAPTDDGFTRYYTLESGDNPWKIAKKFNVSMSELLRLNDLDEGKARSLRPGDRIRVH